MKPIELAASYEPITATRAKLHLESAQQHNIILTVLHESIHGLNVAAYDLADHVQEEFEVSDGESLTFIARREAAIVGSLVNEIDTSEESRWLLLPKGGYNLFVHQSCLEDDASTPRKRRTPGPLTISTMRLARLASLAQAHYQLAEKPLPAGLRLAWPAITEAQDLNEEAHSREILKLFCAILEELGISSTATIEALWASARNAS